MAYEKKDGDIAVWRNRNKSGRQPDWKGELLLNGVTYEVAFWERNDMLSGQAKVNERVTRDRETHNLIQGAAYLAAQQEQREPLYKTAEKMGNPPAPAEPQSMFDNNPEDDLPF